MLTLPPKFEASLGNGTRTSLFPLLVIYKDSRIDEPDTWDRSNSINTLNRHLYTKQNKGQKICQQY